MECHYRTDVERRLRERIAKLLDPREELKGLSRVILQAVEIGEPCYAYVIPYRRLEIPRAGYFFALFLKTPGERRLAVFDRAYRDYRECQKAANQYLRYFPLFLYSSRFLLPPPWKAEKQDS